MVIVAVVFGRVGSHVEKVSDGLVDISCTASDNAGASASASGGGASASASGGGGGDEGTTRRW